MKECISVRSDDDGSSLFAPKLAAEELSKWLKAQKIWPRPEEAIWNSKNEPVDVDVHLDQNPEEIAPKISEWFDGLKLKPEKAHKGDEYTWRFSEADYRRAIRFLHPGKE